MGIRSEDERALTSLRVFRKFIIRPPPPPSCSRKDNQQQAESVELDANGVVSLECYNLWLETRRTRPPTPEKSFQRTLSAHLGGVDGRLPFTPEEERAILKVIRRKGKWPCFVDSKPRFGLMGFRAKGYHERLAEEAGQVFLPDKNDDNEKEEEEEEPVVVQQQKQQQPLRPVRTSRRLAVQRHVRPRHYREPVLDEEEEGDDLLDERPTTTTTKRQSKRLKQTQHHAPPAPLPQTSSSSCSDDEDQTKHAPPTSSSSCEEEEHVLDDDEFHSLAPQVRYFAEKAKGIFSRLYQTGVDTWETVLRLGRLTMISQGNFFPIHPQELERLFLQECDLYPGEGIILIDPLSSNPNDRVVFANELAEAKLGKITRNQGGVNRPLFAPTEQFTMLKAIVRAWARPNEYVNTVIKVTYGDRVPRPAVSMWIKTVPEKKVVFARAIL